MPNMIKQCNFKVSYSGVIDSLHVSLNPLDLYIESCDRVGFKSFLVTNRLPFGGWPRYKRRSAGKVQKQRITVSLTDN